MSDIKQAAKWMQEGKSVRRKDREEMFVGALHWIRGNDLQPIIFSPASLLAEDWELVPEPPSGERGKG